MRGLSESVEVNLTRKIAMYYSAEQLRVRVNSNLSLIVPTVSL